MTNDRQTAEELKYSRNNALQGQRLTNNMFEVWGNLAPFDGRRTGSTVEALLTKIVNW
jgi:hypothetical protein